MTSLVNTLGLKSNPFEHYVAETEPDIAQYAVKPPYFEAIDARATNTSSYILFGDRGAGKSATRLTVFKELWAKKGAGQKVPLAVNMVDFSAAVNGKKLNGLSEKLLVGEVAFVVIESLLIWLSSLEDDDRAVFQEGMNAEEHVLCYELLRDHYISRPQSKRNKSSHEAMLLFNQAFVAKSKLWAEQRWTSIASVFAKTLDALLKRQTGISDVAPDVIDIIRKESDHDFDSIVLLRKLVDLARIFDFTGIVLLIDKVDETEATNNSADQTAALIHPLLARVQLMEIAGFSWIFFLWSRVKSAFEADTYKVRLDKLGHATVSWDRDFFVLMLNLRMKFFSDGKLDFPGLFIANVNIEAIYDELVSVSNRSPRELVRLMDVILREHDIANSPKEGINLLSWDSMQPGLDKYVTDVISSVYGEKLLNQIFRLNRNSFTNKDVQLTFRVGAPSARARIQAWENAGIIKLSGTRAAEGAQGGKPAYEYTIADARIERVMKRQLVSYTEPVVEEPEFELETD